MEQNKLPFETVFNENKEKIFRLAYKFTGNSMEAEDITQEVFLRAYRNYSNFRFDSEVFSWLYRIAVNLCAEKARKRQRERKKTGELLSIDGKMENSEGGENEPQLADPSDIKPLEILAKKEVQEIVRNEISKLPAKYAEVIVLKELEEMSYGEISRALGISINSIGVRLIRARGMLKKRLKKFL